MFSLRCIVDVRPENVFYRVYVHAMAVAGKLNAIVEPSCNVRNKVSRSVGARSPGSHAGTSLVSESIATHSHTSPTAPSAMFFRREVFLFGSDESPHLVNLQAAAVQIMKGFALKLCASSTDLNQKAQGGFLRDPVILTVENSNSGKKKQTKPKQTLEDRILAQMKTNPAKDWVSSDVANGIGANKDSIQSIMSNMAQARQKLVKGEKGYHLPRPQAA